MFTSKKTLFLDDDGRVVPSENMLVGKRYTKVANTPGLRKYYEILESGQIVANGPHRPSRKS